MPPDDHPHLTGVLWYLGCLLPGLNGHIVLPPAAVLQTTRFLHTHLSSHVLGALGTAALHSPPSSTHMIAEPLHTRRNTRTHAHIRKAVIHEQIITWTYVKTRACIHRDTHNWISPKHRACMHSHGAAPNTNTHTHRYRVGVYWKHASLAKPKVIFSVELGFRIQKGSSSIFDWMGTARAGKVGRGARICTWDPLPITFRSKLPVTRSTGSISCRFLVLKRRGGLLWG